MTPFWKTAAVSTVGSRHLKAEQNCADSSSVLWDEAAQTLVLVAADGAGSAEGGALGASYAAEAVMQLVPTLLQESSEITREGLENLLRELARRTRGYLEEKVNQTSVSIASESVENEVVSEVVALEPITPETVAPETNEVDEILYVLEIEGEPQIEQVECVSTIPVEDDIASNDPQNYATTLLVVIQTHDYLAALQIGDGFIIVTTRQPEMFKLIEASKGQYANQTCFLTSYDSFDELLNSGHVKVSVRSSDDVCAIALITDGLESVAMNLREVTPYPPFFLEMMKGLWTLAPNIYAQKLEQFFLEDTKLNDKTDDDKTLVLAINTLRPPNFEMSAYPGTLVHSTMTPHKANPSPRVISLKE